MVHIYDTILHTTPQRAIFVHIITFVWRSEHTATTQRKYAIAGLQCAKRKRRGNCVSAPAIRLWLNIPHALAS